MKYCLIVVMLVSTLVLGTCSSSNIVSSGSGSFRYSKSCDEEIQQNTTLQRDEEDLLETGRMLANQTLMQNLSNTTVPKTSAALLNTTTAINSTNMVNTTLPLNSTLATDYTPQELAAIEAEEAQTPGCRIVRNCASIFRPGLGQVYHCTPQLVCTPNSP